MYNNLYGEKYDKNLSIKDIAKLVKKEASKKYPNCKISAKTEHGEVIRIAVTLDKEEYRAKTIDEVPRGAIYLNIERKIGHDGIIEEENFKEYIENNVVKSVKTLKIENDIKTMLENYNYNRSDIMSDYFDYNFYGFVDMEYKEENWISYKKRLRGGAIHLFLYAIFLFKISFRQKFVKKQLINIQDYNNNLKQIKLKSKQ